MRPENRKLIVEALSAQALLLAAYARIQFSTGFELLGHHTRRKSLELRHLAAMYQSESEAAL